MRYFLLAILLFVSIISNAQETTSVKADLLAKAKKQNTAGWVLLGTGFTATTVGLIVGMNEVTTDIAFALTFQEHESKSTSTVWLIAGSAMMASSIPFFLASSRNRKKVATAFMRMESGLELKNASLVPSSFPALGLRISL